jgi:hypothetical protein
LIELVRGNIVVFDTTTHAAYQRALTNALEARSS